MYIYKIVNLINENFYIGQTTRTLNQRLWQHKHHAIKLKKKTYLHRAINKYGIENFKIEILECVDDINKLNEKEKYWIQKLKPKYNMTEGGGGISGYKFSEEYKKHFSETRKGRKLTEEQKKHLSIINKGEKNPMYGRCGELNPFYGKKHSDEFINKKSKEYCFLTPSNEKIYIKNLTKFCRENNLHTGNMNWLYQGKIKSYKGYRKIS